MYIIHEKEREQRLKKISIALIAFGILLSQIFLFKFDLTNSFKYTGISVHHIFPILQLGDTFDAIIITTSGIGYLFFLMFFISHYKKAKQNQSRFITTGIVLCACALIHEVYIFTQAYLDCFTPQPFFVGIPLLLISLEIFNVVYNDKNE
jgi:hypothetical protein